MKAIITIYNKSDNGLILRNNYVQEVPSYELKEYLMYFYYSLEELEASVEKVNSELKKDKFSSIIEVEKQFVYHIRFVS